MATHGSVAASVRRSKEKHPAHFCPVAGCLWRTVNSRTGDFLGPCRNHPQQSKSFAFASSYGAGMGGRYVSDGHGCVERDPDYYSPGGFN